jgi:hypothetical protein
VRQERKKQGKTELRKKGGPGKRIMKKQGKEDLRKKEEPGNRIIKERKM